MTIDIALCQFGTPYQGNLPPALVLPHGGGDKNLALNAVSSLYQGPCVLAIVSTTKIRIDAKQTAGALDPDASPVVAPSEQQVFVALPPGKWYLKGNTWS